ncbi:DUF5683 domain-containing protein [Jejuia spongiicola]|uniref:DUF5683 domain-containing protein n=1 Tax=Jejuia spongiicola TaxID=2942207 RepID=A0ABT0QKX9_9FLAO|nr:DUF5683 domain-containing protein [Gaetbulibacter sp. 4G1]MCL6296605.1 DUF5683 domain-containing protein [Jejuia spongiicola]PIA80737.1 hypothetical protein BFR04_16130 [Gaetbulibacter sp. 4G1]
MLNKLPITGIFLFLSCFSLLAQDKDKNKELGELPKEVVIDSIIKIKEPINPLSPAKAAFYSAVLPGLGQAYNKKYWKIPIVYVALGAGTYFYITNNNEYKRYRDAYKSRLAGFTNDEFYLDSEGNQLETPRVTDDGLRRAQKLFRRNKEVSLLVTVGLYALNIIDANVDAHLMQYNVDENLTLAPHYKINEIDATGNLGLTLNFKF